METTVREPISISTQKNEGGGLVHVPEKRSDVAYQRRAYQSTTVDQMEAMFAVSYTQQPLYELNSDLFILQKCAKTRREADPWWEVDLGRPQHIHSLVIDLIGSNSGQSFSLYILLLDGPVGFEDPFLHRYPLVPVTISLFLFSQCSEKMCCS